MFHRCDDNGTSLTTQTNEAPFDVTNKEWINGFECFGFATRGDDTRVHDTPLVAVSFETHNHETGEKSTTRVHMTAANIRALSAALVDANVEVAVAERLAAEKGD
tara:strand:+ start:605 stop:919 length:315 start_codon:yes stop_codon:yes gene_type:complete